MHDAKALKRLYYALFFGNYFFSHCAFIRAFILEEGKIPYTVHFTFNNIGLSEPAINFQGLILIRAAIVGLGAWGKTLVDSVQSTPGPIHFTTAFTRSPDKVRSYCLDQAIRLAPSWDAVLADPDIDAIVLATPNSQHEIQITQAARALKHVYVEKPFTLNLKGALNALEAVKLAGVTLGVGLNRRFHPNMIELIDRVKTGKLGVIGSMNAELTATSGFYRPTTSWRVREDEEPAGALVSVGIHLIDAMVAMAGPVSHVHCVASCRGGPHGNDTTHLMLQFTSGVTGLIYCSVAAARNHRIAVYGTQGFAEILKPQMDTFRFIPSVSGRASHLAKIPEAEVIERPGFNYVGESLKHFAQCIEHKTPYPISANDLLHEERILAAAIESASTHHQIQIVD